MASSLFELPNAVVAIGGIGEKFARRAAEVAIRARAAEAVDFGRNCGRNLAGAEGWRRWPDSRSGRCCHRRRVIRLRGGEWVLATSQEVSDAAEKQELLDQVWR